MHTTFKPVNYNPSHLSRSGLQETISKDVPPASSNSLVVCLAPPAKIANGMSFAADDGAAVGEAEIDGAFFFLPLFLELSTFV